MSNFEKYDLHNNTQDSRRKSCKNIYNFDSTIGASSIFQKIKSNLSNLIFLGKEDGIENNSIHKNKNLFLKSSLDNLQSNDVYQIYDAPTLELNMSQELDNPNHINTNTNLEYTNKNINDTRVRKFSLESSRTSHTKKKSNPLARIVNYITEKKFSGKEKNDPRNSSFTSSNSAFKTIDDKKIINLNSKKIINYNDFFEVIKDKNLIKPVPIRRSASEFSQIAKKRNRPLDNSFFLREEEKQNEKGFKRRKLITDDDRSLFSSVQNLNKIRNFQRDDVSMKSLNSVMSNKFMKVDKDKNNMEKIADDDESMNIIIPENKSVVRSFYSKTLDEIKSEIEQKRGKNLRMLDEISSKSRKSKNEMKMDYDEKKKFLSNYYKEKEKNFKEMDLLSKGGKISLDESDMIKDRNLSYSKSSMMIESAPKKSKNVDIVKSSNFDICSNKSEKLSQEIETQKEMVKKTNENINHNLFFGQQDKKVTFGDSNALTDKKNNQYGDKIQGKEIESIRGTETNSSIQPSIFTINNNINNPENSLGFVDSKKSQEEKPKESFSINIPVKEPEKKEEKSGLFGLGLDGAKESKPTIFGNVVEKKEVTDTSSFCLFGEKKEEKLKGLFDTLTKKEEIPVKTGLFNSSIDKKEEKTGLDAKDKKDDKLVIFGTVEKKQENPFSLFAAQEKKEEKPVISFGFNKAEEKSTNQPLKSNFSIIDKEENGTKQEQEQKSSSLFPSVVAKTNLEDKSPFSIKENEPVKSVEEKPVLFGNKESQPTKNYAFGTTINTNGTANLDGSAHTSQSLFSGFKDGKDDKSFPKFGASSENKPNFFNNENKDKESSSATTTQVLFGNIQGPSPQSLKNQEPLNPTSSQDASTSFFKKDQSTTSLVSDSNPFLTSYGADHKASSIFQSTINKPGMNINNSFSADGMSTNSIGTPAFNSTVGFNKISSSSINNSNRSGDIYQNLDKNSVSKGIGMTNFSTNHNISNSSNPFMPKSHVGPKADIFPGSGDHNESMAISPITSPKMMPKNDNIYPNIFQSVGTFGGNNPSTTQPASISGNNMFNSQFQIPTTIGNTPFINAANTTNSNSLFGNQNAIQTFGGSHTQGLFGGSNLGNSMNTPVTSGLFGSSGPGNTFSLGKKK